MVVAPPTAAPETRQSSGQPVATIPAPEPPVATVPGNGRAPEQAVVIAPPRGVERAVVVAPPRTGGPVVLTPGAQPAIVVAPPRQAMGSSGEDLDAAVAGPGSAQ